MLEKSQVLFSIYSKWPWYIKISKGELSKIEIFYRLNLLLLTDHKATKIQIYDYE